MGIVSLFKLNRNRKQIMLKPLLLIIGSAALLMGCQSAPQQVQAINNPGRDVNLMFHRESNFVGSLKDANVSVDSIEVCSIPNGAECKTTVSAGKRTIKVDATFTIGHFSKEYTLESGKTYRFIISARNAQLVAVAAGAGIGSLAGGDLGAIAGATVGEVADYQLNKNGTSVDNGAFTMEPFHN